MLPAHTLVTPRWACQSHHLVVRRYQSSSLAGLHVLPAFQDFVAFAAAMEEALLGTSAEMGGDLEALQ